MHFARSLTTTGRILAAAALCAVAAATTPSVASAQGTTSRKPFEALSASALTMRDSMVAMARAQVGKRYVSGGTNPDRGFDCSGLVTYVLSALQVSVPRTASQQAKVGEAVARDVSRLQPGDLLMFGKTRTTVSHVGIYIGNGKYVHASSVAGKVIESPIERPSSALTRVWLSARRVLSLDDAGDLLAAATPRG
jgi:cell wall-associated NlpC family hydrolase